MSWYVASTVNRTSKYINPGIYTVSIPNNASIINFEIIGAGGSTSGSGSGGYIKGSINVSTFKGQTITIVTGAVGASDINPSNASYIYIENGSLFVMAGAGGCGSGAAGNQYGGWGGGGTFINIPTTTNWVAIGGNGQTSGGGSGGQGGQTGGGGASGSCGAPPDAPGSGRPIPEDYKQAFGGSSNTTTAGGSGYTGGGGGCGAGGGSSYYNSSYTSIILSYAGNTIPNNILVGYGREYQNGYISIEFKS